MDYEYEAFKKGFHDGAFTIISVFDISEKDIKEKLSFGISDNRTYEIYQIWQNTIKDKKIQREEDILLKKVEERINKFKKSLIRYIDRRNIKS